MRKLTPILLIALLLPQVALAAWWNPFSWKIFTRVFSPKVETIQTSTTTDPNVEIEQLKKEIEVLKNTPSQQKNHVPVTSVTNKSTETKTSEEYKRALIPKFADGSARAEASAEFGNTMANVIKEGIRDLQSTILEGETLADRASSWPEFRDFVDEVNDGYLEKIQYAQKVVDTLVTIKQNLESLGNAVNTEFTRVAKLPNMSLDEFNKASNNFDTLNKQIYELTTTQERIVTDYGEVLHKWAGEEKIFWAEIKKAMDHLSRSLESRPRQYYFAPVPQVYVPSIPRITNTHCNVYSSYGSGTINCTTY